MHYKLLTCPKIQLSLKPLAIRRLHCWLSVVPQNLCCQRLHYKGTGSWHCKYVFLKYHRWQLFLSVLFYWSFTRSRAPGVGVVHICCCLVMHDVTWRAPRARAGCTLAVPKL